MKNYVYLYTCEAYGPVSAPDEATAREEFETQLGRGGSIMELRGFQTWAEREEDIKLYREQEAKAAGQ